MTSPGSSLSEPRRATDAQDDASQALLVGEYLLAAVLAVVLFAALSVLHVLVIREAGPGITSEVQQVAIVTLVFGFVAALFPGLPLAMGAHFAVRHSPSEAAHVAAFAVVGILTAVSFLAVLQILEPEPEPWLMVAETGTATAVARFGVGRAHFARRTAA